MVQSVALKRPQGGVGGGCFMFPCPGSALVRGTLFLTYLAAAGLPNIVSIVWESHVYGCLYCPRGHTACPGPSRASRTDSRPRGAPHEAGAGRLPTGAVFCCFLLQPIQGLPSIQTGLWVPNLLAPARTNLQLLESWSSWLIAPE